MESASGWLPQIVLTAVGLNFIDFFLLVCASVAVAGDLERVLETLYSFGLSLFVICTTGEGNKQTN